MYSIFDDLHIFEMANNHQGDLEHGQSIVRAMSKAAHGAGVRAAVKLQYRDLDTFIHPDYLTEEGRKKVKHIERFLSTRIEKGHFKKLIDSIQAEGMLAVVTPFDEASVDWCIEHDVDIIKVASCSADDWPLLGKIIEPKKPIIVSTGGQSIADIDNLYSFFSHRGASFALLHCVGLYPTPPELQSLDVIDRMQRRFPDVAIGYSGHEAPDDLDVVKIAIAKGARILERHVGVPTDKIALNAYSMNPSQTEAWLAAAAKARILCNAGTAGMGGSVLTSEKTVAEIESVSLKDLARGVSASVEISTGDEINNDMVFFSFPRQPGQIASGEFREGITASRDYAVNEPITEKQGPDITKSTRALIHDFRGMFNEAGIHIGQGRGIELSHHFGLENFAETGALLISIVNAHYCKKLVSQLPGQNHPVHKHNIKDESFQVLWGDLHVSLDGVGHDLVPGDVLTVPHGIWHAFSSQGGVIFEEISTTSISGDSEYQDQKINSLDPMWRKTVTGGW